MGTRTTRDELVAKARGYVSRQIAEATFQQFLSIFENFVFDLLRLWLTAYPGSLGKRTIEYQAILNLPDKDAITRLVIDRELNEVSFQRPANWFAYLEERARLGCPAADEVERIAEAKASRDVLVHNRGVINATYRLKAGRLARFAAGERIEVAEPYHREIWELVGKVVNDLAVAALGKVS